MKSAIGFAPRLPETFRIPSPNSKESHAALACFEILTPSLTPNRKYPTSFLQQTVVTPQTAIYKATNGREVFLIVHPDERILTTPANPKF